MNSLAWTHRSWISSLRYATRRRRDLCPVWPGNPVTAHWGVPDPAAVTGDEAQQRKAFRDAYLALENRIKIFVALPFDKLDRMAIKRNVDEIGRRPAARRLELS